MAKKHLLGRFLCSTMLTGVATGVAAPAIAQDEAASDDRIVVTGTRIAREDLSAPSPVTRIDSEQLTLTNTVNTEQFLSTLPQVIPGLDSTSNNPGNGTATTQLRGLGPKRTLVLVDGARYVSQGAQIGEAGVVDLNAIPAALVERIEVVTGGASAVYGSDAVAGVVNFILKDDFEGVQFDVSNEMSAAGWDANIFNAALTMGGNFADGRGNAIMSLSYTNREALFQADRDFASVTLQDGGGDTFLLGGSGSVLGGQFISLANTNNGTTGTDPDDDMEPADLDDEPAGFLTPGGMPAYPCTSPGGGQTCTNNVTFNGTSAGRRFISPQDQYNYAPTNYLQLPQERYSIYAGGSYEISDNIEVYGRGVFAASIVDSQLAPTPVGGTFILNLDNPNLSDEFRQALIDTYDWVDPDLSNGNQSDVQDRDGDGEVDDILISTGRRTTETGPRNSLRDTASFQMQVGLRGDIWEGWSYDAFYQFSRASVSQVQTGNVSRSAYQAALLNGSMNIFGVDTIDPDVASSISRTGAIKDEVEQHQFIATISGTWDSLRSPFAETGIGAAFGVEYREEAARSTPDSVLGPDVIGFNASLPVAGRYDVYEAFMEASIPVIENATLFDSFVINGAYRYSDYSTAAVGGVHSFAVGGEWVPFEELGLRIRTQFQRAVRAPNVAELFAAFTNGFPGANDPCSTGNGKYDELTDGDASNGEVPAATLHANCSANGVPASRVGTTFQLSGQIEGLFGGNPDLFQETADTLTIGGVWQPDFLDGAVFQIDFYDIKVKDAIVGLPMQLFLDECYISGNATACAIFVGGRDPSTGAIGNPFFVNIGGQNIATLKARGIDFQASYSFDADALGMPSSWGGFNLNYIGSYTMKNGIQQTPNTAFIDCAGQYGNFCNEPTPTYKHTTQVGWLFGPLTTSVRWRYIGAVDEDGTGGAGPLSEHIDAFNYLDVTMHWAVNEHLDLTVGVQNITGKDAPLLGSCCNEQANTWPGTYETLGRTLFFGGSVRF